MASQVFKTETITLMSGREIELKPLNIKGVRKFQQKLKEYNEALVKASDKNEVEEDAFLDNFIDMTQVCLGRLAPDLAESKELIEEELDIETIFKILEVCAGMNFNDPNLQAAAMLASQNQ
jgi:hypothetical protein